MDPKDPEHEPTFRYFRSIRNTLIDDDMRMQHDQSLASRDHKKIAATSTGCDVYHNLSIVEITNPSNYLIFIDFLAVFFAFIHIFLI